MKLTKKQRSTIVIVLLFGLTACSDNGMTDQPESVAASAPDNAEKPAAATQAAPMIIPPPMTIPAPASSAVFNTEINNANDAARFLMQASFGGTLQEINALVDTNASSWLIDEFGKPKGETYVERLAQAFPSEPQPKGLPNSKLLWQSMIKDDDQLRMRMAYALSQIVVASDFKASNRPFMMAYYMDILETNAFGNYRQLLNDITYSPKMARYLTYLKNRKANPKTGREPDENYARELMQLFTIGLAELNPDGTVKLGDNGKPIATYSNDDVVGLSRVFTGLSYDNHDFFYSGVGTPAATKPLKMFDERHSEREKQFLGVVIPAGTSGNESIRIALDTLFSHPNVGPFISRQLIQRFTSSHPTPAYVKRVADAFNSGTYNAIDGAVFGSGNRGDLSATLAAILLDDSIHSDSVSMGDVLAGKVREPVLRYLHLLRAFKSAPVDILNKESFLADTTATSHKLGQHPMRSTSVFNFYRPGYVAPNTMSGDAGRTVPELQIVNEASVIGMVNFLTRYSVDRTSDEGVDASLVPDYSLEITLADDAPQLVNHLDTLLTAGTLGDFDRGRIEAIVQSIAIEPTTAAEDRIARVHAAVISTISSSAHATLF